MLDLVLHGLNEKVLDHEFYEFDELWDAFLNNYLNNENKKALEKYSGASIEDIATSPHYYDELPLKSKHMFTNWVEEHGGFRYAEHYEPNSCPSWWYMTPLSGILKNEWMIHFTSHVDAIKREGFRFGAPDANHLAVTFMGDIWDRTDRDNTTEEGYNFGYTLDEDIERRGNMAKTGNYYGNAAVMFKADCIKAHHRTDNENQAIFWGPDVSPVNIIPLVHTASGWAAPIIEGTFPSLKALTTKIKSGS